MNERQQRFCPVCDRAFEPGEALLRCSGCGVLHHPGCWVRNEGCATAEPHEAQSEPVAYPGAPRGKRDRQSDPRRRNRDPGFSPYGPDIKTVPGPAPPRPARSPRGNPLPVPLAAPQPVPEPPVPVYQEEADDDPEFVIGGPPPEPAPAGPPRAAAPRRAAQGPSMHKPMPQVYRDRGILRFWYVPVALAITIGVAAAVVWAGGRYLLDDTDGVPLADPAETETTAAAGTTTTPTGSTPVPGGGSTPDPDATESEPTPAPGDDGVAVGSNVVVSGTGDCLNIRASASLEAAIITCLPDGTELRVAGGPVLADELRWLRVETPDGEGWAADQFLSEQ